MNRDPQSFYAALHVTPDATAAQIQRSFRALIRRSHPDVDVSSDAAPDGEEVRRILQSYAVLRDPASRAAYDPASLPRPPGTARAGGAASGTAAAGPPAAGVTGTPATRSGGRDIPVRLHPGGQPVLRVTPVRWERGPE